MKQFKLTLARPDASIETMDIIAKIMDRLYKDFDLIDDPDLFCNMELSELLTTRQLKDLAVFIFGNDFPSTVEKLGAFRLIGDGAGKFPDVCTNCGYDWYYSHSRMYCSKCGHSENVEPYEHLGNPFDGFGFATIN